MVDGLRFISSETLDAIYRNVVSVKSVTELYSNKEALVIFLDLDSTKQQYKYIRNCIVMY